MQFLKDGVQTVGARLMYCESLTHISLTSILWDIGKQYSLRCDAAKRAVPSGAILLAKRIFIKYMTI